MGWRIVQQPNKLLARFSEVVDDFTDYDMSIGEAVALCIDEYRMGQQEAKEKVQRGIDGGQQRFDEALQIVERVHGKREATKRIRELSGS